METDEIKICREFLEEILEKESWFFSMTSNNSCDLLLLAGTAKIGSRDSLSYIDIFLVCRNKVQIQYSLTPVTVYSYKGETIELSIVSTEKLFNDQYNKENIFWWDKTCVIKSYSEGARNALRKASSLSRKEFLDRLWTNFVYFEINSFNIDKQIKRNDSLSVKIFFNENIRFVVDSILVNYGEFPSLKWFGSTLKKRDKNMYENIIKAQQIKSPEGIKKFNAKLRLSIVDVLKQNNFTEEEINNWESCNLKRITFQYK